MTVDSTGTYPVMRSSGTPPTWTSTLITTVGADSATELGRVRSVLLDRSGALFVVDAGYPRLVKFDSSGALSSQWGRKGSGPGEYLSPYSIAWLGDSLVLLDPGNSRFGLYDSEGRWLRQWPAQPLTGGPDLRLYRTARDEFWTHTVRREGNRLEGALVRYTSTGPHDTLAFIRADKGAVESVLCQTPGGGLYATSAPFSAELLLTVSPKGERVVALSSEYRIAFLAANGDTVRVYQREVPKAAVSDSEWTEGQQEFTRFREKNPGANCDRTSFTRVQNKPVLGSIFFDDVGQLWVEVQAADARHYDVFAKDGRLAGSVSGLPETGGIEPSAVAGRIAFVVPDESGAQTVRVYRINTPSGATP